MIGIYKFTNKFNRKIYIGRSLDIEKRYLEHTKYCINDGNYFHNALKKYGPDNFDFEVLIECPKENLNYWEQFYIKYYCSFENGYNQTLGGETTLGYHHTEETREKCRQANIGRHWSEEQHIKFNNYINENGGGARKGSHHTEEAKEKNRIAHLGKKASEETIIKLSNAVQERISNGTYISPTLGKKPWNYHRGQKDHMSEKALKACSDAGKRSGSMLWIYKDDVQKRCLPEELEYYISLGFIRGRIKIHK